MCMPTSGSGSKPFLPKKPCACCNANTAFGFKNWSWMVGASHRVVSVREQMQHTKRNRVLLQGREQPRSHATALLLLAHHAERYLQKSAGAVWLDDDTAQHTTGRTRGTNDEERLVVGREDLAKSK